MRIELILLCKRTDSLEGTEPVLPNLPDIDFENFAFADSATFFRKLTTI